MSAPPNMHIKDAEILISFVLYPVSEAIATSNFWADCKVCPLDALVHSMLARPADDSTGMQTDVLLSVECSLKFQLDET